MVMEFLDRLTLKHTPIIVTLRSAVGPLQTVVAVFGGRDERKYNSEPGGNDE
jgi:hypothetical protein